MKYYGNKKNSKNISPIALCTVREYSYTLFYKKIEEILDLLAPYRKMTQKEIKLEQMPWITRGILVSMGIRDDLLKRRNNDKDPD